MPKPEMLEIKKLRFAVLVDCPLLKKWQMDTVQHLLDIMWERRLYGTENSQTIISQQILQEKHVSLRLL